MGRVGYTVSLVVLLGVIAFAVRARADEAPTWRVEVAPYVWVLAGASYSSVKFEANATLNTFSASSEKTIDGWDPIIGGRVATRLGGHGTLGFYGDIGGGARANTVWQAIGTYRYQFSDHFGGTLGYRSYDLDVTRGGIGYDVMIAGPIVGLNFIF